MFLTYTIQNNDPRHRNNKILMYCNIIATHTITTTTTYYTATTTTTTTIIININDTTNKYAHRTHHNSNAQTRVPTILFVNLYSKFPFLS